MNTAASTASLATVEGDEEAIAGVADLDAVMVDEGGSQLPVVPGE